MNDSITNQGNSKLNRRRGKILFYTFALSLLAISLLFFALSAGKPIMGISLLLNSDGWAVSSVDPNGTAIQAGIEVGDIPEVINGQEAQVFLQKYQGDGYVFGLLIEEITVSDDNGQLNTADINNASTPLNLSIELFTWFIICLISWITGFLVYHKKPENVSAILLCLCGLALGLALSANMATERLGAGSIAIHAAVIAATIGPWLLLHYFIILPEERTRLRNSPLIYLIYLPALIITILYPIIGYADGQTLPDFRTVRFLGYMVGFLAVIVVAILNYVRAASLRTRQQMKIILIGCVIAISPFLGISVLPAVMEGTDIMPFSFSMLFLSFIPLSMGYAVITKRLMDIDIFIRRGVVYGSITVFMAAILIAAISLTLVFRESAGILERILVALLLGGLATVLFGPVKKWIENTIDKLFYKDRYDYRIKIKELSDSLKRLNDISSASSIIVGTLTDTLQLAGVCLFIETENRGFQASASRGIFTDIGREKQLLKVISQQRNSRMEFPNSTSNIDSDVAYFIPLVAGGKETGFLFLSPKKTGQDYSPSDMYLVQDLAVVSAASLHSMLVIANDIAERKRAEEALKHAAEEWRTTFDSITDMIAIIGTNRRIVRVNRAFANTLNTTPQELVGKYCYEVVHDSDKPHHLCTFNIVVSTNKSCSHELFEPKLDKHLECTMSPFVDAGGSIIGVVHILKDITQRKNMEAEQQSLRNKAEISSRLVSVGEMAAGIAHEINNPLTGVIGFSELLLDEDLPPDIKEQVKIIAEGSNQVKDIVKRMLTFTRQAKPYKTSMDIHELIDNTMELRRYVFKTANIEVIRQYDTTLPWINVDPGQLQQVFLNLIINAEYSMKKVHGQGILKIATGRDNGYIVISFIDDGQGMSEETLSKLFHPFFTTKDTGEGTGLGLSLSRSIILEHGGTIEARSELGQGATFTIKLPVTPQAEESELEAPIEMNVEKAAGGKASILVIDDEPAIRSLVKKVLTLDGHYVDDVEEPAQALEKLEIGKYDIILLDMRMPGMSGKELYTKIISKWPDMTNHVIFITGDALDSSTLRFFKEYELSFITKPLDNAALRQKINEILGQK